VRVLHVIPSIDISYGGPSKSVSELVILLAQKDLQIHLITQNSCNPYLTENKHQNLQITYIKSLVWGKTLRQNCSSFHIDLLHGHSLWQMPVHKMAKRARKKNIPYIISPRGMLEPWALNSGKLKKQFALALFQRRDLQNASCIHATSDMEFENIRRFGFKNPIAIIPNGLDLSEFSLLGKNKNKKKKSILFLSRIHPKKGIELLIQAWSKIDKNERRDWQVNIAGNGEADYIINLQQQINVSGLENEIFILGHKFGEEKSRLYQTADLFVLPSYSENFGMVIAEALASGVPVITTKGTPWEELNTRNAGWWIDIGLEPLVKTLHEAISLNQSERNIIGLNGRKLIEENYSIELVGGKMIQLYEWILNGRQKPQFVSI
jgi:glycosyltransferase involved in cell wall biosynthesis